MHGQAYNRDAGTGSGLFAGKERMSGK